MAEKKTTPAVSKQTPPAQKTSILTNPFKREERKSVNAGAIAIEESRAVAEALGKIQIAKTFPRDEAIAFDEIMDACKQKSIAEDGEYSYPRGGQNVTGPSIRLAEEMARHWGNMDFGLRELSQGEGFSEMEAYAWDMQKNVYTSQKFKVKHEREKKEGAVALTGTRDIYEVTANMGMRRVRARILALLPASVKDAAVVQCRLTLIGDLNDLPTRTKKMVSEFQKFKVTEKQIEKRLGHTLDKITADEFGDMLSVFNSLRDGISKPADWFEGADKTDPGTAAGALNAEINKNEEGQHLV
jgi:hypothetical protein